MGADGVSVSLFCRGDRFFVRICALVLYPRARRWRKSFDFLTPRPRRRRAVRLAFFRGNDSFYRHYRDRLHRFRHRARQFERRSSTPLIYKKKKENRSREKSFERIVGACMMGQGETFCLLSRSLFL